jgi:hypothetical protein
VEVLLSGLLGALLVFCIGWLRERYRNERERQGLLRLLASEIEHNAVVMQTIQDSDTQLLASCNLTLMKTEAWRASRASAAALSPTLLKTLDDYYRPLETLLTLQRFSDADEERMKRLKINTMGEILGLERLPRSHDPWGEAERSMLEAQQRAQGRVRKYLGSPIWGPVLLGADRWARRQSQVLPQRHEDSP